MFKRNLGLMSEESMVVTTGVGKHRHDDLNENVLDFYGQINSFGRKVNYHLLAKNYREVSFYCHIISRTSNDFIGVLALCVRYSRKSGVHIFTKILLGTE